MDHTMVHAASLGLCEHCGVLICLEGLPADAMDAKWVCPGCGGELTHKSFGYKTDQGGKEKWVGPEGKWTTGKPTEDFVLGPYFVVPRLSVFL